MLGGGCASGTLTDAGEGEARALIVLLFFITGSLWGAHDMHGGKVLLFIPGIRVCICQMFWIYGSYFSFFVRILGIYIFTKKYENKRKRENTYIPLEYDSWQQELPETNEYKFLVRKLIINFCEKMVFLYRSSFTNDNV